MSKKNTAAAQSQRSRVRERERVSSRDRRRKKNTKPPPPPRGGRSIGRRMSTRLFFRLLGIFIGLNIVICIIATAGCIIYSETRLEIAVAHLSSEGDAALEGISQYLAVEKLDGQYSYGYHIPRVLAAMLPESTASYNRWVVEYAEWNSIGSGIEYNLFYTSDDAAVYRLGVNLSAFYEYFCVGFGVLHIWELITLIVKSRKNSKLIHRSLDPIWELTRTAETLGRAAEKHDSMPDMAAIKGALESIDASRLDTRIEVGETQQELRGIAAAINEMLDRVRDAYAAQIRFVSDASHELRTPISVIQGYANLLDRWGKNDEKTLQEGIDAIRSEADAMKSLVEQLLFLARGDNNTIALDPESFDMKELCEELAQEARLIDSMHEFRVEAESVPVYADRKLIKQAARILLDNAIKYTDPGGLITLRAQSEDGRAVLSVTDTGVGISEELLPRIFDRFVRADESRTRSSGGAGLGLAIAKWIVSRHGGHLEALSRVGVGTRIMIILPASKKPGLTLAPGKPPVPEPQLELRKSEPAAVEPRLELRTPPEPEPEPPVPVIDAVPTPVLTLTPDPAPRLENPADFAEPPAPARLDTAAPQEPPEAL